jgi:TP901 family phage tail tape measure protein
MAAFNIVAALQLQAPSNVQSVVGQIQRQLNNLNATVNINIPTGALQTITQLNQQVTSLSQNLRNLQGQAQTTSTTISSISSSTATAAGSANQLNNNFAVTAAQLRVTASSLNTATGSLDNFGRAAGLAGRRYTAFLLAGGAITTFISAIRQGIGESLNFQRELVRLSQVGDDTGTQIASISREVTRLATTYGVSSRELIGVATTLRQAGISANETKIALEALAKTAVAPSFDNLRETTEGAIAIMAQFGLQAKDLEGALGSVNAVAASFATESKDLIEVVRRVGGQFRVAGGDLNQLLALFTAVRSTTRESAESIATGLRTVFARFQRPQTLETLEELGIKLRYTREEAAKLGNANLANQFIGPYQAVQRISEGLRSLRTTDPRYAAIVEELGGYRQISKVIPLLQEASRAQQAYNVAQAGQSSLTENAAQAQDALIIKITKLKEEFADLIRTISNSTAFKAFLDVSLALASAIISITKAITPLLPLLAGLTAYKLATSSTALISGLSAGLTGQGPRRFARGGIVPGVGDTDSVHAALMPGEFVIRKQAAQSIGYDRLHRMNRLATGGQPGATPRRAYVFDYDDTLAVLSNEDKAKGFSAYSDPAAVSRARPTVLASFAARQSQQYPTYILTARHANTAEALGQFANQQGINLTGIESMAQRHDIKQPMAKDPTKFRKEATTEFKKQYILKQLAGQYDEVHFFDDKEENIKLAQAVPGVIPRKVVPKVRLQGFAAGGDVVLKPGIRLGQVSQIAGAVKNPIVEGSIKLNRVDDFTKKWYNTQLSQYKAWPGLNAYAFGELGKYAAKAPVETYIMSDKESTNIDNIVGKGAAGFDKAISDLVGASNYRHLISNNQKWKQDTSGYVLESYVSTFGNIIASGGSAPIDFPKLTVADRKFLQTVFGRTLRANYLDAKRSSVPAPDIIKKGVLSNLFYTDEPTNIIAAEVKREYNKYARANGLPVKKSLGGLVQHFASGGVVSSDNVKKILGEFKERGIDGTDLVKKIRLVEDISNKNVTGSVIRGYGAFLPSSGEIRLNKNLIGDVDTLRTVLAHELGHAADLKLGGGKYSSLDESSTANVYASRRSKEVEQSFANRTDKIYNAGYINYKAAKHESFANIFKDYLLTGDTPDTLLDKVLGRGFKSNIINPLTKQKTGLLGRVKGLFGFAGGGSITDSIPALLTPGEYVLNRHAVNRIGLANLNYMNNSGNASRVQRFATGGVVHMASGGQPVGESVTVSAGNIGQVVQSLGLLPPAFAALLRQIQIAIPNFQHLGEAVIRVENNMRATFLGQAGLTRGPGLPTSGNVNPDADTQRAAIAQDLVNVDRVRRVRRRVGTYYMAAQGTPFGEGATGPTPQDELESYYTGAYSLARRPRAGRDIPVNEEALRRVEPTYAPLERRINERIQSELSARGGGDFSLQTRSQVGSTAIERIRQEMIQELEIQLRAQRNIRTATERERIARETIDRHLTDLQANVQVTAANRPAGSQPGLLEAAFAGRQEGVGEPPPTFRQRLRSFATGFGPFALSAAVTYGGSYAEQAAGSPDEAITQGRQGRFIAGRTAGGAATGAGIGLGIAGSVAALGGPVGILAAGLIVLTTTTIGLVTAWRSAAAEIQKTKDDIAKTNLGEVLQNIASGVRQLTPSSINEIRANISTNNDEFRRRLNTVRTTGPEYDATRLQLQREIFGRNLPAAAGVLNRSAVDITRQYSVNPTGLNTTQIDTEVNRLVTIFRNGNNGLNSQFLQLIADLQHGGNFEEALRNYTRVIQQEISNLRALSAEEANNKFIRSFIGMSQAIESASHHLDSFGRTIQLSTALQGGQISAGINPNAGAALGLLGGPGSREAVSALQRIGAPFGQQGVALTQTGQAVDVVRRELTNALGAVTGGNALEGRGYSQEVQGILESRLPVAGRNEATSVLISNIIGRLGTSETQDIRRFQESLRTNPDKVIKDLMGPGVEEFISQAQHISGRLQAAADTFGNALVNVQQSFIRAGEAADQASALRGQTFRSQIGLASYQQNRNLLFSTPISQLERPLVERQQRLTREAGIGGADIYNEQAIGRAILNVNTQARGLQQRLETTPQGTPQYAQAQTSLANLTRVAANLNQALANAANAAERLAIVDERLQEVKQREQAAQGLTERYLSGDPQARFQLLRGQNASLEIERSGGNLSSLLPQQISEIFGYLRSAGAAQVSPTGRTGQELAEFFTRQSAGGVPLLAAQTLPGLTQQRIGLEQDRIRTQQSAAGAATTQEQVIRDTANTNYVNAVNANSQAITNINQSLNELIIEQRRTNLVAARARVAELEPQRRQYEALQGVALPGRRISQEDIAALNTPEVQTRIRNVVGIQNRVNRFNTTVSSGGFADLANEFSGLLTANPSALRFNTGRDELGLLARRFELNNRVTTQLPGIDSPHNIYSDFARNLREVSRTEGATALTQDRIREIFTSSARTVGGQQVRRQAGIDAGAESIALSQNLAGTNVDVDRLVNNLLQGSASSIQDFQQSLQTFQRSNSLSDFESSLRSATEAVNALLGGGGKSGGRKGTATLATGGIIYAANGMFTPRGTDIIPAMLTPGEFVINRESTSRYLPLLQAINAQQRNPSSIPRPPINENNPFGALGEDPSVENNVLRLFGIPTTTRNLSTPEIIQNAITSSVIGQQNLVGINQTGRGISAGLSNLTIGRRAPGAYLQQLSNSRPNQELIKVIQDQYYRSNRFALVTGRGFASGGYVGYYQGGTTTPVPAPTATPTGGGIGDLSSSINTFMQGVSMFSGAMERLASIVGQLAHIPTSIELVGNHNVSVSILGAEAMAALERPLQDLITRKVTEAINNLIDNRFADSGMGRLNQAEQPIGNT